MNIKCFFKHCACVGWSINHLCQLTHFYFYSNPLSFRLIYIYIKYTYHFLIVFPLPFSRPFTFHFVILLLKDTEALLFGFQSIAETIDVNYSDVIPGLIGLIPRINISNVMLADTVMYTIGTYPDTCYLFRDAWHDIFFQLILINNNYPLIR